MVEHNSIRRDFHETSNMYPNLSANLSKDQQFIPNKINEIKIILLSRLKKELMSKTISKYIASFDYLDKS